MTPRQIELARHALGFQRPEQKCSYRNHFVAGSGHPDYADWVAMTGTGEARQRKKAPYCGGDDCFWLTTIGAKAALRSGETLDPEDFPDAHT